MKHVRLKPTRYDPTQNTHHLVKGTAAYQNALRRELDKRLKLTANYIHRLKTQEFKMQDAARAAESKRIDEALKLRDEHDRRMNDMITSRSEATSSANSARLDRLEKFMYEQSGKSTGISGVWAVILGLFSVVAVGVAIYAAFH